MLPNGLKYMVISYPELDKSAVGIDVYVGASDDPREYQGLAHFLEHTLFLGSQKYPDASYFDNFLNNNSGTSNANTSIESTNFHYDISNEALEESIKIFSEFFKSPLFSKEYIDKELNAIESEFKLDYRDDFQRLSQLIFFEGYKESTFNTFINGNLETLKKDEIRDKVMEFYNNKYDAQIMSLSIFSNKTIEELKNIVIKYFSDIKSVLGYKLTKKNYLYDKNNMGYLYKIIPIKNNSYIVFNWTINKTYSKYMKAGPMTFVESILGHETKHSLTSYLKKKGYIYSLVSSSEYIQDLSTNISIRIKLSDEGYNNYEKIISIILSYINYLQKEEIHKDFYEEIKQLSEIDFFLDIQNDPIDFCENVSRDLNLLKPNEPYYISSKIEEYKPDLLKEILNSLTPQNLNIYLLSNKLQTEKEYLENKNLYNTEKIYGTEYMKIKKNFSKYIADIKSFQDSDLDYPELNPFIAKDLSMIDLVKENINLDEFKYPKKMWDKDSIIWYKPVVKYKIPKVYIVGKAYVSNMNLNFETFYIYIEIFNKLIEKENSDFNYFGTISENSFSISCGISSIHIKASGYSDSLEKYITEYFKILSKFVEIQKIENIISKLNKILDEQINSAKNFYLGDVGTQTKKTALFILKKLKVLNKIEIYENFRKDLDQNKIPEEFLFCIKNFLKKVKYEWLVEGNILYKNVEKIIQKIETELYNLFGGKKQEHKEPLSINEIRKQREVKLPCDKIYRYNFCSKDPKNESSTMLVFFQTINANFNDKNAFNPQLYENYIKIFCLNYIMFYIFNELFYEILRTKEQLGYDVSFSTETNNNIFGFKFYVSSSKYNPDEILERINKFIVDNDLNKEENFSDENFESYKKSMLVDLMEKPLTLESEMGRDLAYIFDRSYTFDERLKMIKYTNEKLTKKDVIDYFNEFIFLKAKRLEVALYSSVNKEKEKEEYKMDIEENDNIKSEKEVKEESNVDMVEVKKKDKNENDENNNYVLPSYQNVEKVIIKDIQDFHRHCVYYDNEFY
jgi:insulysin